jgi:hypothetical protein
MGAFHLGVTADALRFIRRAVQKSPLFPLEKLFCGTGFNRRETFTWNTILFVSWSFATAITEKGAMPRIGHVMTLMAHQST